MKGITQQIEEFSEKICRDFCKYAGTEDDEEICEFLQNGGTCPLDALTGWNIPEKDEDKHEPHQLTKEEIDLLTQKPAEEIQAQMQDLCDATISSIKAIQEYMTVGRVEQVLQKMIADDNKQEDTE